MSIIFTFCILLIVANLLVLRSTSTRQGGLGINLQNVTCPKCGERMPATRYPRSLYQALFGGWTCKCCSCEIDKWGKARA